MDVMWLHDTLGPLIHMNLHSLTLMGYENDSGEMGTLGGGFTDNPLKCIFTPACSFKNKLMDSDLITYNPSFFV